MRAFLTQKTGNAIRAIGKMKNLTLSAASRKSASGVTSSPRPSLTGPIYEHNNHNNFPTDTRMTSVDEEIDDEPNNFLCATNKLKDPRVCNERSDSGFSECSACSTPSASCLCHLTTQLQDTIVEEKSNNSTSSTSEPHETTENIQNSEHDMHSEVSSLELDDASKINCDDITDISIRVPTRRELFQTDEGDMMSEIERRKVSLENTATTRTTPSRLRQEFSLEKLKKTNKVAQLMEKFEATDEVTIVPNSKFKSPPPVTNDNKKGLKSITVHTNDHCTNPLISALPITNRTCDLPKQHSFHAAHANSNHTISNDSLLVAKTAAAAGPKASTANSLSSTSGTRKSSSPSSNDTTTFRLSDRVREATERLSKPKQQATVTMTSDKTTKASILKQNSNFARSKEFWKR